MVRLPKVLIGVACGNRDVPFDFELTLNRAQYGAGKAFLVERMNAIGHITDDARNDIAQKAIENNFDYVFYADTDMLFPDAAIMRMIRRTSEIPSSELPVVAGLYNSRKGYHIHAYKWEEDRQQFRTIAHQVDGFKLNNGLFQVDAAGTGCMLIDVSVFEEIGMPYFEYKYEQRDGKWDRWSEDMVFSKKLYDKGIHIYLDTDIVCGHMQRFQIKQSDDENYSIMEI